MWNYNRQIVIRYASFIAGLALIAILVNQSGELQPDFSSKIGLKNFLTNLSISVEFLPWWSYLLFLCGTFLLLVIGVPSILIFSIVLVTRGFYQAFFLTWSAQTMVSFAAIAWARRRNISSNQAPIANRMRTLSSSFWSFAFWSRIYYAFPLRTIDSFTPFVHAERQPYKSIFTAVVAAIGFRILLPSLWVNSLVILATSLGQNPSEDVSRVLLWSSAVIIYTLIPRIPELFVCPDNIKQVLFCVEEPSRLSDKKTGDQIPENSSKAAQLKMPPAKIEPVGVRPRQQLVK